MNRLDFAANVTVIAGTLVLAGLFIHDRVTQRSVKGSEEVAVGDHLAPMGRYQWAAHSQTLVLFLRQGCVYCEKSLPFYRNLMSLERAQRLQVHLVTVFPEEIARVREYCQRNGLTSETLSDIAPNVLRVLGTPTLILVNSNGRVLKTWIGELSTPQETGVLRALQ
jgi:hypothetical protein